MIIQVHFLYHHNRNLPFSNIEEPLEMPPICKDFSMLEIINDYPNHNKSSEDFFEVMSEIESLLFKMKKQCQRFWR